MPPLSLLLRASLVPIGLALAGRGLSDLGEEADRRRAELAELAALTEAHRRYLAGDGPAPEPEDFPPAPALEVELSEESPVPRRSRAGMIALGLLGVAIGYGAVSGYRAAGRDRAQLAAAVGAARSSVRLAQPPAPGSPADLAADVRPECKCGAPIVNGLCTARVRDEDGEADERLVTVDPERSTSRGAYRCPWGQCDYQEPAGGATGSRALRLTLHANSCDNRPRSAGVKA